MENNQNTTEFDSLKNKSSWGGKREGAGRKEGSQNKATKEQRMVEQEMKERVVRSAQQLLNSQMNLAQGCQYLYKIGYELDEKGNKRKTKPELITSQGVIESYLAGEYEDSEEFYFITADKPDNKALDSLFDRVFGKAITHIEMTGKDGKDLFPESPEDAESYAEYKRKQLGTMEESEQGGDENQPDSVDSGQPPQE